MFALTNVCLLIADRSLLRDMGSGFRDRREHFEPIDLWPWLLAAAVVVGGLVILSRWFTRREAQRFYSSPRGLMRALCHAHGLDRSDERFLTQLARIRGMESPVQLFLHPEAFAVDEESPDELRRHAEAIAALYARLFETPSSDDEEQGGINGEDAVSHDAIPANAAGDGVEASAPLDDPSAVSSAKSADPASSRAGGAESESTRQGAANPAWTPAPSLFQPAPATLATGAAPAALREADALGEDRVAAEQRDASFSELQAVRALETLMRQIRAANPEKNPAEPRVAQPPRRPDAALAKNSPDQRSRTVKDEATPLGPSTGLGPGIAAMMQTRDV